MPSARKLFCKVIETRHLTPSVVSIRFIPDRLFRFEAGQFISVHIGGGQFRLYSLANPFDHAKRDGYELCIKVVGEGSRFMESLKVGDSFEAKAPYGDFIYHSDPKATAMLMIASSTGLAPLRAIVLDPKFELQRPPLVHCVLGARDESEVFYREDFAAKGVGMTVCVSRPTLRLELAERQLQLVEGHLFHGRITDYLRSLPANWAWHSTQYFICGNGLMIDDVTALLRHGHGIADSSIHREAYFKKEDVRGLQSMLIPPRKVKAQ